MTISANWHDKPLMLPDMAEEKAQDILQDILQSREARWQKRLALAAHFGLPVGTLTLNVPGPDKNPPGAARVVGLLAGRWRAALTASGLALVHEEAQQGADGPAWHGVVRGDARTLKRCAVALEEEKEAHAADTLWITEAVSAGGAGLCLSRLADADVLNAKGQPLGRAELGLPPRPCLLCARPALLCMREHRHSPAELQNLRRRILALIAQSEGCH